MSSSYSPPPLLVSQIGALVSSGHFSSRSDVVKEALRFLLEEKSHLRTAAAVELYRSGDTTLTKGAEIASLRPESFREVLLDQGLMLPDTVEWESIE